MTTLTITEEGSVYSSRQVSPPTPLLFLHSHRLIICILLLLANYFSLANSLGMSTAVICMVNSSSTIDRIGKETNSRTCAVKYNESIELEFTSQGTFDWTSSQQSLLLSARFYGSCITVAFSGIVTDRLGGDLVLTVFLLLSSTITCFTPFLAYANYYILLGFRFLLGALESFQQPAINCLATKWFPTGEKTTAASIYTTGSQFAGGFSSLFAALLCKSSILGGWPSIFYVFGGTSCVFLLIWVLFGYGGPAKNGWVKDEERSYLDERITTRNIGGKRTTSLARMLRSNAVHSIVICYFGSAFSTTILQAFLPTFLHELGLPIETIGFYILSPCLAEIAAKAMFGPLIDYWAKHGILSLNCATKWSQCISSFGAAIALMLLSIIPSCSSPEIALYIMIAYGVVKCGCVSGVYTSMLSISPGNVGTLSSLTAISKVAASLASTSIVNALAATDIPYKWTLIFAIAAVFQCIGGLHFMFFGTTDEQSW